MWQVASGYSRYKHNWLKALEGLGDESTSCQGACISNTQNLLRSPSLSAAVGSVRTGAQCASSYSGSCVSDAPRLMEDTSCETSCAVDCTLSLGTAASRPDIPARLSRAGSPAQEPSWQLCSRSEQADAAVRRVCEQERSEPGMSWAASCGGMEPTLPPDYFGPQVVASERGPRPSDGVQRSGSSRWTNFCVRVTEKEAAPRTGLLSMLEKYDSMPTRKSWLAADLTPSTVMSVEGKLDSKASDQCLQESSSVVRICAHCGTTKTPLWRNGPQGPKSLCNACGIRFKKAGRRAAASATSELQNCPSAMMGAAKAGKRKLGGIEHQYWVYPQDSRPRKRGRAPSLRPDDSLFSGASCVTWQPCLLAPSSQVCPPREIHSTPPPGSQQENKAQTGAFSTEEEEGAVLLMALSCGMVQS